jgi:hypothetical protein
MGNRGSPLHQAAGPAIGNRSTILNDRLADRIWTAVEQSVESLDPAAARVRLYQDGLPLCGREMEIVADLAKAGNRNHQLLIRLIHKGALLMGTESQALLLEEDRLIKQAVSGGHGARDAKESLERQEMAQSLLKKRVQFIAQRIDNTLGPGETGILFLGMQHVLDQYMNRNILMIRPLAGLLEAQREDQ